MYRCVLRHSIINSDIRGRRVIGYDDPLSHNVILCVPRTSKVSVIYRISNTVCRYSSLHNTWICYTYQYVCHQSCPSILLFEAFCCTDANFVLFVPFPEETINMMMKPRWIVCSIGALAMYLETETNNICVYQDL